MAFFKFNFDKPGKGVEKDEPDQTAPVKFLTVFGRRFTKFMQLNLTFMIPCFFALIMMMCVYYIPYFIGLQSLPGVVFGSYSINIYNMYVVPTPLILLSPFFAGLMVVARRLANKEYSFIWTEYWQGVKDNWKQFLINGIVCYLAYFILSFCFMFYGSKISESGFNYIPLIISLILIVTFLFSQIYVPVLMVSVNMKTFPIYKNSLIFAIMGVVRNILIAVIFALVILFYNYIVPIYNITAFLGLVLLILIVPAFLAYTVVYLSYPLIDDCVIKPYYKKKEEVEGPPAPKPRVLSYQEMEENKSEYVYIDGKLVKKDDENNE